MDFLWAKPNLRSRPASHHFVEACDGALLAQCPDSVGASGLQAWRQGRAGNLVKILHVITRSEIGGAQVVVRELVRNLPAGYLPLVAAGEHGYLEEECARLGVQFHLVPGLVRNINPLSDVSALFRLIGLIRREKIDIVHAHTSKAGVLARVACWLTGTPSVFTAHTWSFDEGISLSQKHIAIPIERFAALIGGTIIAVSDANRQKALRQRIVAPHKVVRIWLGLPDLPERAQPDLPGRIHIMMTARFAAQKDHSTLLRALVRVSGDWNLTLVGDGPLFNESRLLARKLGIEDRVCFMGNQSNVPHLLARASIFVLSTRWEGLPVSILEAMRAGLPIVASNVGGINEMVTDGLTGLLTTPEDEVSLAAALQRLVDSPELRRSMGVCGRVRYEADFQIANCIQEHIDLYSRTMMRLQRA